MTKKSAKPSARSRAYVFLLINAICWGAALPIVKPALEFTTAYRYLFYRFTIASLLSIPLLIHYLPKIKHLQKSFWLITAIELIGTTLSLGLLYQGLARTTSLEASLIETTTPIFTVLAGILYLHEKEEDQEWLGLVLAFAGTVMISVLPLLQLGNAQAGPPAFSFLGNMLIVLQNIFTAIYFVLAKKYYKKLPKLYVASISFWVGMISFFFLGLFELGGSFSNFLRIIPADLSHFSVWLAAIYMAVFGSVIALTAYIEGQDKIEASEANLFFYLQPLIYMPLSVFVLHENIDQLSVIGFLIILVGLFIAERRVRKTHTSSLHRHALG